MGLETPLPPSEGEAPPSSKGGTYNKRKFKTALPGLGATAPVSHSRTPKLNMETIDLDVDSGTPDDGTDVTLKKLQAQEIETTQKQLATLRKVHDEQHASAENKARQLKVLEEELAQVRRLASSTDSDRTSDMHSKFGLHTTENKLDTIQMKLEEELQNKEIFTHMIKRLTDELVEAKTTVRETNDQLLLADQDFQTYQVQLHQTRQGQRSLEMAYGELKKKAATRRQKQEKKIVEIRKAIEQRVQQRVRQEEMERKREGIAARAKGDLGTEEEERLKRMFVVRSLYSSMLEQKVQKEALFLEKMEQGFQKIKTATGISDVQEIIQKFKTKDETHQTLMQQDSDTKNRIADLQKEQSELQGAFDEVSTRLMAAGGNREMYQEVDNVDEALNAARKQMNDYKSRATKLDLILEESRMSVRKFLSKLNSQSQELPTLDQLPDAIDRVDSRVTNLLRSVVASLEEMGGGDEDKAQEGELKSHGAGGEGKGSTPFGHANASKVNDMLFQRLMNSDPDTSGKNVRIPLRPSLRQEEAEARQNSTKLYQEEEVTVYAGGTAETFRIAKEQSIDEDEDEEDDTLRPPHAGDIIIDRNTVKQLANMISAREKANLKKTEKPSA
jgi:chromosome segregation ATPase